MSIYRVKQFLKAITAKISNDDIEFINKYLDDNEKKIFNELKVYDKKHCLNVAKEIELYLNNNSGIKLSIGKDDLIKAGILHDIGKTSRNLNPIEKSVLVIADKITKGKLRSYSNIKFINVYYNHGELGYEKLKKYNYDKDFLKLIKNHHNDKFNNDAMKILKESDDKN